jgi:type II secretory pathway component PulJ
MAARRPRRGFSLLDVLIGLTLLAAVFTIGIRFIVSLSEASEESLGRVTARRQVELVRQALDADMSNLVPCSGNGIEGPVVSINATSGAAAAGASSVVVYSDFDRDGTQSTPSVVAWRLNGSSLERAVLGDDCADADPSTAEWRTYATGVTATEAFSVTSGGTDSLYSGSCTGAAAGRCRFDGVRVRFVSEPVSGSGPVTVDASWAVPDASSRL